MLHPLGNVKVRIPETGATVGTGWLPPTVDPRDYTVESPAIGNLTKKQGIRVGAHTAIPTAVDLRLWCSEIENQGNLGSCTANAAAGIVEYSERRAFGTHINASRLFIYKVTRNLMGVVGDTGAWLRQTAGALTLCGAPPEAYWPYTDAAEPGPAQERYFDTEPTAFVYALAKDYAMVKYFSHDPWKNRPSAAAVLNSVTTFLAASPPSMFGFFGFPSFANTNVPGGIPVPCSGEQPAWGHAICAVGYDDNKKVTNTKCNVTTTGALLIRNSWGASWGDHGYGWLPYDYVLKGNALDFWSLLSMTWVDSGQFQLPQ